MEMENVLRDTEDDPKIYHYFDYWIDRRGENFQSSILGNGLSRSEQNAATIAACCLKDYERGQSPILPISSSNFSCITRQQLLLYNIKYSFAWKIFGLYLATFFLFVPSFKGRLLSLIFHSYSILIFSMDLYMKDQFFDYQKCNVIEQKRSRVLFHGMKIFLLLFFLQTSLDYLSTNNTAHVFALAISFFKPIVFFYQSRQARDALEALISISNKLLHVILIEFFSILIFAAVACRLYNEYESFQSLPQAWVSLFALSTTVVNPSIWMPVYNESRWNAVFFVIFIVVNIFYLHSLVLSVVFQVFIKSATKIHRRSDSDKEESLKVAFLALISTRNNTDNKNQLSSGNNVLIDSRLIYEVLRLLRPHYSQQKLNVLINIILSCDFDNSPEVSQRGIRLQKEEIKQGNKRNLDYDEFRKRIQQALSSSIRNTRKHSTLGVMVEISSVIVAIFNFLFVMIYASQSQSNDMDDKSELIIGSLITLLTLLEMSIRYNPWQHSRRINSINRLNAVLDGMGCIGGIVSSFGIILYISGHESGMEYLLIGRAIGMIQSMRFSVWFREVLKRSLYVLPFLAGPIILILTTMHVFVYIGMALWEGAVDVEEQASNEDVEYLFYLNNFNSYSQGCITVFNILVVNDWHEIATVFLYANRCSSPFIVYLYFVMVIIVVVCIVLNVIVAFFVETFVTQISLVDVEELSNDEGGTSSTQTLQPEASTRISPISRSWIFDSNDLKKTAMKSSSCPITGEILDFDVIRREEFDDIMQSVANDDDKQIEVFARSLLHSIEAVNALTPGRKNNVAHILCCRHSKIQFKTKSFCGLVKVYLPRDEDLQSLITGIKESLLASNSSDQSSNPNQQIVQYLPNPNNNSEMLQISGALLPQNNAIVLLTAVVSESKT
mmetsp:Transcript_3341/g.3723  ORF Transcript_3341/g.3723 Transcript_3341/m.3723 type:complete len:894 (-) Transcript_3341:100-2781(-)